MQNGSQSEQFGSTCYLSLPPAAGFGPDGDLWSVINGSRMLTALQAPAVGYPLDQRGPAAWLAGRWPGQSRSRLPVIDALITLSSALTGVEFRQQARTLRALGLAGRSPSEILVPSVAITGILLDGRGFFAMFDRPVDVLIIGAGHMGCRSARACGTWASTTASLECRCPSGGSTCRRDVSAVIVGLASRPPGRS